VTETRLERKERTRRAILDAALGLSSSSSLAALSLRQVAKEVGIVPTAFYRHFTSLEDLGLALVDESFVSLRALLREVRSGSVAGDTGAMVDHSVDALVAHVHAHRAHFAFIARERVAGPPEVQAAIRHEIELCERELATDLVRLPGLADWPGEDLHVLAGLIVTLMVAAAERLVAVVRPEQERQQVATMRAQLRMVIVGAVGWRPAAR
jgi:AcrR family transcriptional regulator